MGFGKDEDYIKQWVEDIWEVHDENADGSIDKRELKVFIDSCFEKVKPKCEFSDFDFDDFFS